MRINDLHISGEAVVVYINLLEAARVVKAMHQSQDYFHHCCEEAWATVSVSSEDDIQAFIVEGLEELGVDNETP